MVAVEFEQALHEVGLVALVLILGSYAAIPEQLFELISLQVAVEGLAYRRRGVESQFGGRSAVAIA